MSCRPFLFDAHVTTVTAALPEPHFKTETVNYLFGPKASKKLTVTKRKLKWFLFTVARLMKGLFFPNTFR